jgi:hypothetical protein
MTPRSRRATSLPVSLEAQLATYALAATAVFLAPAAHAQVFYTPATIKITDGEYFLNFDCGPRNAFWIANRLEGPTFYGNSARELELNGTMYASVIEDSVEPLALPAGSVVGSSRNFVNAYKKEQIMASAYKSIYYRTYVGVRGNFANTKQAFLGLKFQIGGQVHYGWAEFSVSASATKTNLLVGATLMGYAFENTPNLAIKTGQMSGSIYDPIPQPGTLQALAQGAASHKGSCPDYESSSAAKRQRRKP